ncbi:hypothetical protein BDN67DRAFT_1008369 [Paxillus ammoniavirescens]|nr:hypothetical protein BDN67DRAFT_1008369 [Paxillus ammoniavirescens]
MPDNRTSTPDENSPAFEVSYSQAPEQLVETKSPGFFSRKKRPSLEDHPDDTAMDIKSLVGATPSVAFTQFFRYSSRYELLIDAVGLVAAGAAGAAQDFVLFGAAELKCVQETQSGDAAATAVARQALDTAAASQCGPKCFIPSLHWYRYVSVHVYLHVHLGIHRRGQGVFVKSTFKLC